MKHVKDFDNSGVQNSRLPAGLLLVTIGLLLLANKLGAPIPHWLFSWPMILIVIGIFVGVKSKFENPGAFIMILIGIVFLADKTIPGINFRNYLVPAILIGLGIIFILRPKNANFITNKPRNKNAGLLHANDNYDAAGQSFSPNASIDSEGEYINVQAILGGVKRSIQSKNFKGGEILSFMGGSEINFMHADIQHSVTLEVNNVFGGTKLIIPGNWDVQNNISAVFGGVEDKRVFNTSMPDSNKKIFLKGSCLFGGVEVTNY